MSLAHWRSTSASAGTPDRLAPGPSRPPSGPAGPTPRTSCARRPSSFGSRARRSGDRRGAGRLQVDCLPVGRAPAARRDARGGRGTAQRALRMNEDPLGAAPAARDAERSGRPRRTRPPGSARSSDREVRLLGAVAYWCEGGKEKPWQANVPGQFINSDAGADPAVPPVPEPGGRSGRSSSYRLSIHESADVEAARVVGRGGRGAARSCFRRPTLKTHNPSTVRRNVGDAYRGCLVMDVPRSRGALLEDRGSVRGIAAATELAGVTLRCARGHGPIALCPNLRPGRLMVGPRLLVPIIGVRILSRELLSCG